MQSYDKIFIGGEWVAPSSKNVIPVHSAHSEEKIGSVPEASTADIDRAVAAARDAFDNGPWPRMSAAERAGFMMKLNMNLQARTDQIASTISQEMGSPIAFSQIGQVGAALMVLNFYTELAGRYVFEDVRQGMLGPALVRREPVGVVGAIIPWNVPLFITMLKVAPAMVAGATVILKAAPETALDAMLFAEAVQEAGIPKGVISVLVAGRETSEHLVSHPNVDKISFTGSTAAGRRIASVAGSGLKRVTLELGGKSAAIVLDDADFPQMVPSLISGAMLNNGQACAAQTRWLVSKKRYNEFLEVAAQMVGSMTVGDPLDWSNACGPLVAERQRDRVEGYLRSGKEQGGKIVVGGGRPAHLSKGWYVEPTVVANVDNTMTIAREEVFGPVVVVIPYDDEADAIRIANDSDYGLAGTVWTADIDHGVEIAKQVRTGSYTVNNFLMEFGAPFGGYKNSGIGRELGPEGLEAYLEYKTIHLPMGYEVKPS